VRCPCSIRVIMAAVAGVTGIVVLSHWRSVAERFRRVTLPLWVVNSPDVAYGPYRENVLNVLRPRWGAKKGRPGVVVFHGGAWQFGNRDEMIDRVCRRYLRHGFVVANVEYRRGVEPAAEDAVNALEWFWRQAPTYGADSNRIVVTGESAGGHLALIAAFRSRAHVAAVVNFYGVTDLTALLDRAAIRRALPAENPDAAALRLSPIHYIRSGLPPVLSIHGTADRDVPPSQTVCLTQRIREAGGDASRLSIEGAQHGFTAEQLDTAYDAVFEFLSRHGVSEQ
jgi:acetyl esterase/lipase